MCLTIYFSLVNWWNSSTNDDIFVLGFPSKLATFLLKVKLMQSEICDGWCSARAPPLKWVWLKGQTCMFPLDWDTFLHTGISGYLLVLVLVFVLVFVVLLVLVLELVFVLVFVLVLVLVFVLAFVLVLVLVFVLVFVHACLFVTDPPRANFKLITLCKI